MSISVEPDLFGNLTLGASCTGCAGIHNAPSPDDEAYGSSPDLSGPVEIDFIYNSNSAANGPFGYGRTLTTNFSLSITGDKAIITRGNGSLGRYTRGELVTPSSGSGSGSGSGSPTGISVTRYNPQKVGSRNQLTRSADGTWVETAPDGRKMVYLNAVEGQINRLSYVEDSVGNRHTFFYSDDAKKLLTSITDAYGRRTTLGYNADQTLLQSITDFAGRVTRFEYDAAKIPGKPVLTRIVGPTGCQTSYEYTVTAALTAVIDPNGYRTQYTYDAQRRVLSRYVVGVGTDKYTYGADGNITNALGETVKFETDTNGKVVAGVNDKGQRRTITRDSNGWETARPDMTGATQYTQYNSRGDVLKSTDAIGHSTLYERDTYGNATKITHSDGTFELMDWGSGAVASRRRLLGHTDALGAATSYSYDGHGKVTSVTDALGAVTKLQYDGYGRLIGTTDALNQVTTMEYDAADNLTARVDALGHRWSLEYDGADRPIKSTDAEGGVMQWGHDANGNVTLVIDELGQRTTTVYNAFDLPVSQTDALGGVLRWEYDALGHQIAQVDALGQRSSIEINNLGQVAATVDALGRRTTTEFDADNHPVAIMNALGERTTMERDALSRVRAMVDALGHRTQIEYDARGRQSAVTDANGNRTQMIYDAKGQQIAVVDALNQRTGVEYDAVGRPIATVDANGNRTVMEYDALGQQVAQVDALGHRTQMEYDAAGRHVATVDALNQRTQMDYDKVGRLLATTDANGSVTHKEYDAKGQQIADVDALNQRTVVEYDALGRQTAIVDPGGVTHRTEMSYDAVGQLLSRRDALGNVESFSYDKVGNQVNRTDARGQLTTYTYDKLNRLLSQHLTGGEVIAFTYDPMGQQLTMTDASGTTTNSYDALGRVLSEVNGRGNKLAYEHDAVGRRTVMIDPEGGRTLYAYDANGWLLKLTDPQNGATDYFYDKLGRVLTKTLPNGVKTTHVYNEVGYETLLEERDASGTLLSSYASAYDKVGMKLSVTEKDGSVVSYRYSLTYELAREERTGGGPYLIEYFYDAAGNHLRTLRDGVETTTSTDAANQVTRRVGPNGTVNFSYDADGNLSSETNADGSGKNYFFDGQDRLIAVEVKSAGGVLSHRSEFSYDAFGRLVKSAEFERNGTAWVKQSESGRVFDGLDTVQERGENNQVLAQLTRDGNIGGILSRKVGANTSFFGYDGNGNVTTLSDAQGNSVGHYRYDGFGNTLEATGSSAQENSHRFSTKELHAPSGLYHYGFRFYSPTLGRWFNRDPIREVGGINLHQMAGNNAVNFVDEYGFAQIELRWREVIGGLNHAFLLIWDEDAKGRRIGVPRYFGGYKGDGFVGPLESAPLTSRYGYYVGPSGKQKGAPDFGYFGSKLAGSMLLINDDKPACYYINKLKPISDSITKYGLGYPAGGYGENSNTVTHTLVMFGLGIKTPFKNANLKKEPYLPYWNYVFVPGQVDSRDGHSPLEKYIQDLGAIRKSPYTVMRN